jgi:hypothetical protein
MESNNICHIVCSAVRSYNILFQFSEELIGYILDHLARLDADHLRSVFDAQYMNRGTLLHIANRRGQ